ncbi:MAG: D-alanine--D-alanine ligase [Lachnospiraceae bacterium]|nr:D-alanine--D-alanine ligase [Lachnospiraceae bacterium]
MKKTIAVLFGGQSSEHEVSCMSAVNVVANLDKEKYEQILIGITKEGEWLKVDSVEQIENGSWRESRVHAVISPEATKKSVLLMENGAVTEQKLDVVFPVLHGLYGEDGTVQGILELAKLPYVGCGVLASSVSMDKLYTKIVVDTLGIRQAAYAAVMRSELKEMDKAVEKIEAKLSYPMFIKPSNAGSSCGVSKASDREELVSGLKNAAEHDRKILIEETIVGRELECAVLGGEDCRASGVGEVLAAAEFYDYEAKYHNAESKTDISPVLPEGKEEEIREAAVRIFRALDGYGLSRVDFFLTKDTNEVVFNEINTLPGFTGISMYPMLWEKKGISKPVLVEKLINSALARYDR